ncbi:MAG TPA: D-alanyl-D-alanine carboxypeptidase [Thermoleophilaceae bacterium]|nr:D-alanyl-D-alanine carboxypeptidase [Thermoleophilaceae bacterium]
MTGAAAGLALVGPAAASAENAARLKSRMDRAMNQATARSGAYVFDLTDGKKLYARKAKRRRILASNTKLFTTAAVLDRFGPRARFQTTILADRRPTRRGKIRGDLYLRGGGDPSFGSISFTRRAYGGGGATLQKLARAVERAGVRRITGDVLGDESLFDSLRGGPDSGYGVSQWVGPLSALAYNRGLARENGSAFQTRPPEFAAQKLADALRRRGIRIGGRAGVSRARGRVRSIARARSLTVERLVELTNTVSDNFFAETLAKRLHAATGRRGTTDGGARRVTRFARGLGAKAKLVDGSGLARGNRAGPRGVVRLLRGMRQHDAFRSYWDSLALPGRPGTLSDRRTNRRCRGKTGTISGVSALSGYCRGKSGDLIAFSFLMNGVGYSYDRARRIQDAMTHIVAKYG